MNLRLVAWLLWMSLFLDGCGIYLKADIWIELKDVDTIVLIDHSPVGAIEEIFWSEQLLHPEANLTLSLTDVSVGYSIMTELLHRLECSR